jgi:hypothetical protein
MTEIDGAPRRRRGRPCVYTPAERAQITAHVAARVALGERLADILTARDGMPGRTQFLAWMKREPELGRAYRLARRENARRWWSPPGRPLRYTQALGEAVCGRIAEAAGLEEICAEPGMPSQATVYKWLARHDAFAAAYRRARQVQADRLFDAARAIAQGATGKSWRRDKLLIDTIRWQVGKLAPLKYGARPSGEPAEGLTIILRNFCLETGVGDESSDRVICRDGVYLDQPERLED